MKASTIIQIEISLVCGDEPYDVRLKRGRKWWSIVDVRDKNDYSIYGTSQGRAIAKLAICHIRLENTAGKFSKLGRSR